MKRDDHKRIQRERERENKGISSKSKLNCSFNNLLEQKLYQININHFYFYIPKDLLVQYPK